MFFSFLSHLFPRAPRWWGNKSPIGLPHNTQRDITMAQRSPNTAITRDDVVSLIGYIVFSICIAIIALAIIR